MLDVESIRKDFPILSSRMNGKPLVFLDSAASSQKPQRVIDAFEDYYRCRNANIHRGAYRLSYEATDMYDKTRSRLARFIGASDPATVIFTRNTTESLNLVAQSWGMANLKSGDEIILTELEHHSNLVPWFMIAGRTGAVIKYVPLTEDGRLELDQLEAVITKRTRIMSVAHMSNALGTIHDIVRIREITKAHNVLLCVDGAQGASHLPVHVEDLDVDFYALSAHKMLGPTGVGALYGRRELLEAMPPFLGGGDMILYVTRDGFAPAGLPEKFEAGTPNIAGVVAFHNAIDYLEQTGLDKIHEHEEKLVKAAVSRLSAIPGVILYGTEDWEWRGGIVSFNVEGVHQHDVGSILDEEGIAVRAGHHCCEPFMRSRNLTGTVRASFYLYNTMAEIELLAAGIQRVKEVFKSVVRR
mgnify:CR=1 FL=1